MDVKTAFLNGKIDKELYLEQPDGYEESDKPRDKFVCKLNRALYGLKQAGQLWNQTLHSHLISHKFHQLESEPCIYIQHTRSVITIIATYVDDILIASNNLHNLENTKWMLSKHFDMTDLGQVNQIIGIKVKQDHKAGYISLDQLHYLQKVLQKFKMDDCNPISTPMNPSI